MIPRNKYFIKTRTPGVYTASESSIQETCTQFLILDGWRHLRTDPVSDRATVNAIRAKLAKQGLLSPEVAKLLNARGKGFGEVGMADDLFIRYVGNGAGKIAGRFLFGADTPQADIYARKSGDVLWIEFKSLNGKPKPEQLTWAAAEKSRGALVVIATVDFEPTIDGFQTWYRKSGLARRVR